MNVARRLRHSDEIAPPAVAGLFSRQERAIGAVCIAGPLPIFDRNPLLRATDTNENGCEEVGFSNRFRDIKIHPGSQTALLIALLAGGTAVNISLNAVSRKSGERHSF